jgi:segregation and condensation protein B
MIAYHQPVVQSDLVDMRGNSAYDHIRDLKERGLVKAEPHGRTRLLSTTPLFADYFGLEENDPEAIRKKIIELSKEQSGKEGMDRWLGRRFIGFTPMFASLPELCGIKDFRIINAYSPTEEELAAMDTIQRLVISKGYREKVEKHYAGEILEAGSTTFEDLTEIMELLKVNGDPEMIAEAVGKIGQIREELVSKAMTIGIKAFPETDMIARILNDLRIGISPDGIRIAPDYGTAGDGREIGADADILVPTHDSSDEGLIERVTEKYECIIKGLKEKEGAVQGV